MSERRAGWLSSSGSDGMDPGGSWVGGYQSAKSILHETAGQTPERERDGGLDEWWYGTVMY
jgi:hypothetical protein